MKHRIETADEIQLIGFHISEYNMDVLHTWKVLRSKAHELERMADLGVTYSVSQNEGTGEFAYFAGFPMTKMDISDEKIPVGFRYLSLEPQKYAVFTHTGPAGEITQTKNEIWSKQLAELRLMPLNALEGNRYSTVVERFDHRFIGMGDEQSEMEIWIPIV
jgi:AraC family transcriptional regulator